MPKSLFFQAVALLLLFAQVSHAQKSIKRYIQTNTIPLSTISPDSGEDAGLVAVGKAIGDARIVFLGEQDHGDAPTYLAKTRLIKYLHEKMGFNVLAFESDFFAVNHGWDRVAKDAQSIDTFIHSSIYPVWTYCNTCEELFKQYLPGTFKTATPLQLAGIDNQVDMEFPHGKLGLWLDSVVRDLQLPATKEQGYATPAVDSALWYVYRDTTRLIRMAAWADKINAQAAVRLQPDDFRMMVIHNVEVTLREYRFTGVRQNSVKQLGYAETRDRQMAQNLIWLADVRYPREKIIVWAASAHTARMADNFPRWTTTAPTLGGEFMGDSSRLRLSYSIGFVSREGRAGRLGPKPTYELAKTRGDGFEHWMPDSLAYGFVDLKPYTLANPAAAEQFYLTGLGHLDVMGIWNRVFDGVIYIKEMYPCKQD